MNLLKQITLDLAHVNGGNVIRFHQGDKNAASISAAVYNNGVAYRMTGMTIKYDATIAGYLAEEDADGTVDYNVITIPITENMTALSGKLLIDIKIIDGSGDTATILFTQTVEAFVDKSVIDGAEIIDISGMTIPGRLTNLENKFPVGTEDLADGAVTLDKMAANSVGNTQLRALAVSTSKIADGAVTEDKIADGAIPLVVLDGILINNNTECKVLKNLQQIINLMDRGKRIVYIRTTTGSEPSTDVPLATSPYRIDYVSNSASYGFSGRAIHTGFRINSSDEFILIVDCLKLKSYTGSYTIWEQVTKYLTIS